MSSAPIDIAQTPPAALCFGGLSLAMPHPPVLASIVALAAFASGVASARADVLEIDDAGNVAVVSDMPRRPPAPPMRPFRTPQPALAEMFRASGQRVLVSDRLIEAVAWTESRFNVAAVSPKGARGVMQLMPGTARGLGVDPRDPAQNVYGGAAYLRSLLDAFDGDIVLTLAAYNAGPGAVRRHGGPPPYAETQAYVAQVLNRLAAQADLDP